MPLDDAIELFTTSRQEALEWFRQELTTLRSGRVQPDLVSNVPVEHYGTRTPLQGLASVASSDARTLVITPWDGGALASIEKALVTADLGVQPVVDGNVIRVSFPSLTQEVREQTLRLLNKRAEEARVRFRQGRDEALSLLKHDRTQGVITEDDFYDGRKRLDTLIDEANTEIGTLVDRKADEIKTL